MFTVIYEFKIKQGTDVQFNETWQKMTQIIRDNNVGSYGATLTKTADDTYQSHARWQSQEAWQNMKDFEEIGYGYVTEEFRGMVISAQVISLT